MYYVRARDIPDFNEPEGLRICSVELVENQQKKQGFISCFHVTSVSSRGSYEKSGTSY